MRQAQRRPKPANWGVVLTSNKESHFEKRLENGMEAKLETLKKKWFSKEPEIHPDDEFSVMLHSGELVYVGRYPEGVVLRLNDKEDQVTFLTAEMAAELGAKLAAPKM